MPRCEPECYEYAGIPVEEPEALIKKDADHENVITKKLDYRSAFDAFSGKFIADSNFSDTSAVVVKERRGLAYYYELAPQGEKETLIQKFNRLKAEVMQLKQELTNGDYERETLDVDPASFLDQIFLLQRELECLPLLDEKGSTDPLSSIAATLNDCVTKFQARSSDAPDCESPETSGDVITYKLYYRPELAKCQQFSQLSSFEERISALEKVAGANLGAVMGKISILLGLKGKDHNLFSVLTGIAERLSFLGLSSETLEALKNIKNISSFKNAERTPASEKEIEELYASLTHTMSSLALLPDVIQRLKRFLQILTSY
ncbi:uncharacterized protein LOC135121365 isoform X2 [Zophobas morio]|uniref:uncharacterized protein LOC135121365 isoform X2 n=1 Tax=Zophobas morio TaxID=2755281 RepID=UPI0030838DA1